MVSHMCACVFFHIQQGATVIEIEIELYIIYGENCGACDGIIVWVLINLFFFSLPNKGTASLVIAMTWPTIREKTVCDTSIVRPGTTNNLCVWR
jgi:hypothetical protein